MTHFKLPLALISILLTSQMSEAKAEHFRQIEGLATAAHVQAVGAVRYFKYNVDPVPGSEFLQGEVFDSYCGVASIEKASLFFSGTPQEACAMRRQVRDVLRVVHHTRDHIDDLLADLRHDNSFVYDDVPVNRHRPAIQVTLGRGVNVRFGERCTTPPRHAHGGYHRERAQLRVLHARLTTVERTLEALDRVLNRR